MQKKWNLQDIRPPQPRKSRAPRPVESNEYDEPNEVLDRSSTKSPFKNREQVANIIIEDGTKSANKRLMVSVVLFFVIVGGAIGLSALMGKTELTIYPEHRQPNISAEFTAYPDQRDNSLSYEIMTLETTGEGQVKASGQVNVEQQASGVIEIIKTTPGAERLIKNTRFRNSDGLVFRIQESVVVPGSITGSDGDSVPGTIQAEVFADQAGAEYNLAAGSTFDIPGFEESGFVALYEAITARNPASFIDGFSGPQFKIDDEELSSARQALQLELRNILLARMENEKPANFIAFDGSIAITYNQLPAEEFGENLVTIREQAILQIPLFETIALGSFLAEETIATYDNTPVRVDDPKLIAFQYTIATTSSSIIANETSLTFKLTGKPLLIWEYDIDKLTKDLAGLPQTAINNAVVGYPGILEARVHATPFWKRTFPELAEDIIVIEELKDKE